ncbi:hypothetical protein N0V90_013238 [Kalmusia sp. IMI 367209]|nr:hypothetical protein N0V90_013238 [Kalmusia sp. IMI 367209]
MPPLSPDDMQSAAAGVHIVFVHGLQGHPKRTWTKRIGSKSPYPAYPSETCVERKKRSYLRFWKRNRRVASEDLSLASSYSSLTIVDCPADESYNPPNEVFWPRDVLPSDRPDVRILTWGYDTVVTKGWQPANKNNLFAHARDLLYALERARPLRRPIIFVAHSLGGIMVKEVLRRSDTSREPSIHDIIFSTAAVVFLGTPHRGSPGLANLGEIVRRTASTVLRVDSNATILRTLGCDSPELELCRESFTAQWREYNFRVKTFQEALPLGGIGISRYADKVVPDTSSLLDDAREHAETIGANHMEMVRFSGPGDVGYQKVAGEIRIIVESLYRIQLTQSAPSPASAPVSPPVFINPPSGPSNVWKLHSNDADSQQPQQLLMPPQIFGQQHTFSNPRVVEIPGSMGSRPASRSRTPTHPANQPVPELTALERECLQYLSFAQLGARQENIKLELEGTCKWIFDHPVYHEWVARQDVATHRGMLWIKGKPGAGKSVIMKKLLRTVEDRERPNSIIASFFFNARGAELERNTMGMSQSLLHQILQQHEGMRQDFLRLYLRKKQTQRLWSLEEMELRKFMLYHLSQRIDTPVYLFIDALDECKEDEVRGVVNYLRELTDRAYNSGNNISVCMSSRRYPTISVARCPEIDVEDGNRSDVTKYVHQKILSHADGLVPESLAVSVDSKASHVFLWAVLVVEMLLRGWDNGTPLHELEAMLQCIPQEIDQVFDGLSHTLTEQERPETVRLFQWVLLAKSPLNLGSLQYAIIFGCDKSQRSFTAVHEKEGGFKPQQLIRRITHYSRGLIEVIQRRGSSNTGSGVHDTYTVQVIHESVRDWFFGGGFARLDPALDPHPIAKGHLQIIRTCINVLTTCDFQEMHPLQANVPRNTNNQRDVKGTYWLSNRIVDGIGPNLSKEQDVLDMTRYCADHIFAHAMAAENENVVPEQLLWTLSEPNSKLWANLLVIVTEDHILRFHPSAHNVLTLLCRRGFQKSIAWILENGEDRRAIELHCNAIRACIQGSHIETLKILDRYQQIASIVDETGRNGFHWSCEYFAVAEYSRLETFRALLDFFLQGTVDINAKDNSGMTGLMIVAQSGGNNALKVLIELGAYVDERDNCGRTTLHIAVDKDKYRTMETLLEHGASPEARDNDGETPLHKAAALGRENLTDRLLKASSSLNIQDSTGASPLHLAALSGNGKIVCKLVLAGADPNCADETGQTPLHIAARKISYETLEIMLDNGAEKTRKDRFGMTAADHAEATAREQYIIDLLDPDR